MRILAVILALVLAVYVLSQTNLSVYTGTPARVPWTSSRVRGSPEPPGQFEMRRDYAKLKFDRPVEVAFAPGSDRVFVVQERGKILSFPNLPDAEATDVFFDGATVKNLDKVPDCKGVASVYALAFHPQFATNRYCYIEYNLAFKTNKRNHPNGSRVSRFNVTTANPPRVDTASELILIEFLSGGHNGSSLKFGPDNYLYITTGDAADPNPPDDLKTGQDISDLLASVLRIDADRTEKGKPYAIPADNPFVKTPDARPEVYAYGFRNPFRMNFDPKNGNLWVGDVGWELWELVFCVKSGGNYGWSIMEGSNPVYPNGKRGPTEISKPQASISHAEGASMTGGLVYRGKKLPQLFGHYVFADWQTSRVWSAKCSGEKEDTLEPYKEIAQTDLRIAAFTDDPDGEPIIVDHGGGGLYRLVPNPNYGQSTDFPRRLSDTGLFTNVKTQTPAPGVYPFAINAPQWLDGAEGERWIAAPGTGSMSMGKGVWGDEKPKWPDDTVLVRTLSLQNRYVETQLLHFDGRQWQGYSYAWNDAQTDAELVPAGGAERAIVLSDPTVSGGSRSQNWHYPSRTQCMTCHNVWCDYTLAFNVPQLTRPGRFHAGSGSLVLENQVPVFRENGFLMKPKVSKPKAAKAPVQENEILTNPYDESADLNERARSYLHVNCSQCHRFGGGGTAAFDVRKELRLDKIKAVGVTPMLGDFGIDAAQLICPGDPNRSVMLYRVSKLGRGRMPHIGSETTDVKGVNLLRQWMASLPSKAKSINMINSSIEERLSTTAGALSLVGDIDSGRLSGQAREDVVTKAVAAPNEYVRDLFRRFDSREQSTPRLGAHVDTNKLIARQGDATKGRKVFFESGVQATQSNEGGLCSRCHRVGDQGSKFGPDLTHIAAKYSRPQMLEHILEPSKLILEGFATNMVRLNDGTVLSGIIVSKSPAEIVLKDNLKETRISTADIKKMSAQSVSSMPDGMLADLIPESAADLLEYLSTLK